VHRTRRALCLCCSLALFPALSFAADPFADYRIPAHYWRSWTANLLAGGNHQLIEPEADELLKSATLSGSGGTSFLGGYDSDPRSSAYGFSLTASGARAHRSQEGSEGGPELDETDRDRHAGETVSGFFAFSRYPWNTPIGFTISSTQNAGFSQTWASSGQILKSPPIETHFASNSTSGAYNVAVTFGASASWGRVRDATPVYQAYVLEQRLLELGTIQRELSVGARERLASLYTTEAQLAFAHQRPTKYFWRELERLLREDGVLSEAGLDAYSVQRLLEPLTITGTAVARTAGFSVGPQVFVLTQQTHVSTGSEVSSATYQDGILIASTETTQPRTATNQREDIVVSGLAVEYHRPVGPSWQVDGVSRALLTESGDELLFSTGVGAIWLVTDRWFATAKLNHNLTAPGSGLDRHADQWRIVYGASLSYFLEDSWALQVSAIQTQDHDPVGYNRQESFAIGLTYQLAGFLNAPGLFEPMRLSPPAR
jgi:hypothetical protein